jgi:FMN reductase
MTATSPELVVLVGNPRPDSRTRALAEHLALLIQPSAAVVLELADLTGISYSSDPVAAARPNEAAVDQVRDASILIVATPSYKGTYTGLLKLFLDQLPHRALEGVIALAVAVAGSRQHAHATATDLVRLLEELGARVPTHLALLETELERPDLTDALELVTRARETSAA